MVFQEFQFDGHGHSFASDGVNSPEQIIDAAIAHHLDIIALTDHNTVANLTRFIDYAQHKPILAIPGMELSTNDGDLLIYFADHQQAFKCVSEFQKPTVRTDMRTAIEYYTDRYDALFCIPHPSCAYISSASLSFLENLFNSLPHVYRERVGIEIHNWMSRIFLWQRDKEELQVAKIAQELKCATFAGTDFHLAAHTGKYRTICYLTELTSTAFKQAILQKQTHSDQINPLTITALSQILYASIRAEINSQLRGASFRIPKLAEKAYTRKV